MADIVVLSNEVLSVFMILGILGLVCTFLLKLFNVLKACEVYDIAISIIVLAVGTISYIFIEIGVMVSFGQGVESILLEYNIYFWFSRLFIILLWILWFAELFIYAAASTVDTLTRMTKRRDERVNNHYPY